MEDILAGATWWVADNEVKGSIPVLGYKNGPCINVTKDTIMDLVKSTPEEEIHDLLMYSMYYPDLDSLVILQDGCGVVNHSDQPNSKVIFNPEHDWQKLTAEALRDIKAGEEITQNYGQYSKQNVEWIHEVFQKYLPERLEFEKEANIKKIVE